MGKVSEKSAARRRALRAAQVATISLALGMGACASEVDSPESSDEELVARRRICAVAIQLTSDESSTATYRCGCPVYQHWSYKASACVCDSTNLPPHDLFGCAVPGPFVPPSMAG